MASKNPKKSGFCCFVLSMRVCWKKHFNANNKLYLIENQQPFYFNQMKQELFLMQGN